ncbi:MAG: caspase domain-containing protein [Hyphomicrobiaceae bacterium]|nr:caspase domain-containing protein [Hyphomicrobiaceae bacterium]
MLYLLLASALPAMAAKRVALVIGNAAYKETVPLKNTRNDAKDVLTSLKRLGFEVLEGIDLDKRGMERLIRQFEQSLNGAEVGIFYYAGHGIQVSGQNLLVPIDARLSEEGDIDFETLPLSLVLSRMERTVKTSLVFLDACRDNPLARNLARAMGTRSVNIGRGLAEVKTGTGTLISFSTQPGNVALDGTGRNSPYTTALLEEIKVPGRDILTTLAVVRGTVVKSTNGKQVPWEHTSLLGPVVLISGEPEKSVPSKNVAKLDAPDRLEIIEWNGRINSRDLSFYQFVEKNQNRIIKLTGWANDADVVSQEGNVCTIGHTQGDGTGTLYFIPCQRQAGEWKVTGFFTQDEWDFRRGHMQIILKKVEDGVVLLQRPMIVPNKR